jgi:hypothetical protein
MAEIVASPRHQFSHIKASNQTVTTYCSIKYNHSKMYHTFRTDLGASEYNTIKL